MLAAWGLAVSATAAQPATTTSASAPILPQTPGFHNLYYHGKLNGQDRRLAYVLYLPKGYEPSRPWPTILYLCGVGERGDNHEGVYGNGPPLALKADKALADWAPFVVLAPQCPGDVRWDSPGMPQLVMDLLGMARRTWALDSDRTYLTGLSMGGAGVWNVAMTGKGEFAVVAPFSALVVRRLGTKLTVAIGFAVAAAGCFIGMGMTATSGDGFMAAWTVVVRSFMPVK